MTVEMTNTMHHLRFSKYDIKYRDENGYYLRDDWTSFWDIGKICEGELLTMEEYERVERNYLDALRDIVQTIGISHITIAHIDWHDFTQDDFDFTIKEGSSVSIDQALYLAKLTLRNQFWISLEGSELKINFSSEMYAYVEFTIEPDIIKNIISKHHLFWENREFWYFDD